MTRRGSWWPVLDADSFAVERGVDVLVPTRSRPVELATTLAGLAAQGGEPFGVLVSDQSDGEPSWSHPAVASMVRILAHRGHPVRLVRHLPRRGLAEHRASLLAGSAARFVLFLDDDVWLEPDVVERLLTAIRRLGCGFVGNAPHGLSFLDDVRPGDQRYEELAGPPGPETMSPHGPEAARARLHSAANLAHLTARLGLGPGDWRAYRVAWLGACVLYDRVKLVDAGGFDFWQLVPDRHVGEDVAAQARVLARYGGAGIIPSGAYHLESETTAPHGEPECYPYVADQVTTRPP